MKVLMILLSMSLCSVPLTNFGLHEKGHVQKFEEEKKSSFALFLSHFDKVDRPGDFDASRLEKYLGKESLSVSKSARKRQPQFIHLNNFIPEMKAAKFSRVGPPNVRPIVRFYLNENTVAVIYATNYFFDHASVRIMMSLFDLNGNLVVQEKKKRTGMMHKFPLNIASIDPIRTTTCDFTDRNTIHRNTYKNIWEKELSKNGIDKNQIISHDLEKSEIILIDDMGKISVQMKKPSFAGLD